MRAQQLDIELSSSRARSYAPANRSKTRITNQYPKRVLMQSSRFRMHVIRPKIKDGFATTAKRAVVKPSLSSSFFLHSSFILPSLFLPEVLQD